MEASSSRPSRLFPLAFSTRTTEQPAALSAVDWMAGVLIVGADAGVTDQVAASAVLAVLARTFMGPVHYKSKTHCL